MSGPGAVVVTGGASGIGRAVAAEFAAHGHPVVALDHRAPPEPPPAGVELVLGDVREPADNERAVAAARVRAPRLHAFVGNAGIHDGGVALADLPGPELAALARRVLDVDVVGYLVGARAAAMALAEDGGSFVFTLSDASFLVRGNGAGVAYATAKHAALGLVRHLAADLAPRVRVNAVAPGGVLTGLRAAVGDRDERAVFDRPDEIAQAVRGLNPMGVLATPEGLAPLYRFLASAEAGAMTGEILRPDGGLAVR